MTFTGRHFLKELDFTVAEWNSLLELSAELKAAKKERRQQPLLAGMNIALVFEKTSTRTRCAFEVAAHDMGAHATYLDPSGSQLGHKESVADTAAVLGRYFEGIQYRGFDQSVVEELAAHAGVPVWNGLTDQWHPTQALCDMLTIREHATRPLDEVAIAYVGDARSNVGNSVLVGSAMMGLDVRMVSPGPLQNSAEVVESARAVAAETGARVTVTDDLAAVEGADFVYTDIWVSMGEPKEIWAERIELLRDYQVNADLMARTGRADAKFLHCLPAFHDRRTTIGEQIFTEFGLDGIEVTDEVFGSPASVVFDQAENRMHTIKAVMVATLT
ncbi:ornithine carbamoyltransferase [Aestuariimicrobium ganziense]|uniref:ornithine carbamoyltransferase n=1 Tax=Aestuariimicrobium ganziense TaxID=2773677 RepID=UPI00194056F1|nr:ornithine carbamoyltransferase [Aestuariimicrobium ganziense]